MYEGQGPISVVRAKITSLDRVGYTVGVQTEMDNAVHDGISVEPTMVNSDGDGSYWMPETNSTVWLCYPSEGSQPFIMGGATLPTELDEGDDAEDPNNYRMNRPVLNEGDVALAVKDSARIIVRKGGTIEIGASSSALRQYIPLANLVREFSQNWEHTTGGGLMSFLCRDNDPLFGSETTPTEFKLQVKEFCEETGIPKIDLRLGRIKDEDDQKIPTGDLGAIVARFNINDAYTVWVDRDGNYASKIHGVVFESYLGPRTKHQLQSVRDIIKGTLKGNYQQREVNVHTTDDLHVGRDRRVRVDGGLEEKVSGSVLRTGSAVTEEYGSVVRTVGGGVEESMAGAHTQSIGNNRTVAVTGDSSETVAGTKSAMVTGTANPLNTAYQVYVNGGVLSLHDALGKVVISSGTPTQLSALAKIALRPTGSIQMLSPIGVSKYEQNPTGIQLSTVLGEISLDQAGTVTLGVGPVFGGVLTTLTQPFDLVTGVPNIGSLSVQAGGPPGSTFATPPLLSTFIPDLTP
jgi:hypothetical protein